MFQTRPLGIYLNDHLAGAAGAIELGQRLIAEKEGSEPDNRLAALIDEIKEDRLVLEDLMTQLDVDRDPVKQALGWIGEKVSRIKLAIGSGPPELGRLLSLEALSAGVQGKRSLWLSLQRIQPNHPALADVDLADLIERADSQLSVLDELRASIAPSALADDRASDSD